MSPQTQQKIQRDVNDASAFLASGDHKGAALQIFGNGNTAKTLLSTCLPGGYV
jgi:hypothetical protein